MNEALRATIYFYEEHTDKRVKVAREWVYSFDNLNALYLDAYAKSAHNLHPDYITLEDIRYNDNNELEFFEVMSFPIFGENPLAYERA